MRKWLALVLVALAGAVEAQPLTGGLLGRGASYSNFVPPAGCASGYVPYFDASLKMACSPTVYAPATNTTTLGTLAAKNVTAIPLPASGSITVTPTGTTGSTTYTYSLQACLADGTCNAAGASSTTASGHATLSASNFNRLSWSAVAGAASYKVRRDVGGATQGVIWTGTALTVDDAGLAGDGSGKLAVDGTGTVTGRGVLAAGSTASVGGETTRIGGVIYIKTTSVATSGTTLETLATYTMQPTAMPVNGSVVRIRAWGRHAANTNSATLAVLFGATTLITGTTAVSGAVLSLEAIVVRTGATSQVAFSQRIIGGSSFTVYTTPAEDVTSALTISVTGTSGTAAGDISLDGLLIEVLQ